MCLILPKKFLDKILSQIEILEVNKTFFLKKIESAEVMPIDDKKPISEQTELV